MGVPGLRWSSVLLPAAAIVLFDYLRHEVIYGRAHTWWEEAILLLGVLVITFITSHFLFGHAEGARRREREAETLRQISTEIASSLDPDSVRTAVLTRGREVLGADCIGISLSDSNASALTMLTRYSDTPTVVAKARGTNLLQEVMAAGEPREWNWGIYSGQGWSCGPCQHCFALPLRVGSRVLGALCVGTVEPLPEGSRARAVAAQVANLASVALANALLHQRVQNVATLEERFRIAREMHDSLAQVLGYLSMKARAGREMLSRGLLTPLDTELAEMSQVADEAYVDVREGIFGLRASAHLSGSLKDGLREYLEKFSRQSGVTVRLDAPEDFRAELPPRTEIQMVRVIQEALANVRKHSKATAAQVKLEEREGQLRVSIEDDGRGFDPERPEAKTDLSYGLDTMRERLREIGGELLVESAPGRGTLVVATAPTGGHTGGTGGED